MTQSMLFDDMADPAAVKAVDARRKQKSGAGKPEKLARKSDPASSFEAVGQFRESGGIQTHEDMILNALYQLGKATGHALVDKIAELYPEKPLTHVQVMRRTGAMMAIHKGDLVDCVCGKRCQELSPK